jgi:hypothetical protein
MIKLATTLITIFTTVLLLITASFADEGTIEDRRIPKKFIKPDMPPNLSAGPNVGDGPLRVLWDQPWPQSGSAFQSQDYEDENNTDDVYAADDFFVSGHWTIYGIAIPAITFYEPPDSCCLTSATKLNFMIYKDPPPLCPWAGNPGAPDGYPGGGNAPIWSVSLSPEDSQLDIDEFDYGDGSCVNYIFLVLTTPVELERGSYWLVFYPELKSSCGDAYLLTSSSMRGYDGQLIYPNDTDPYWSNWFSFHDRFSIDHQDLVFMIMGTSTGGSNPGVDLLLLGD